MFSTGVLIFLTICATIQLIAIVADPTSRLKGKSSLQMKAALKSETFGSTNIVLNRNGQITAVFFALVLVPLSILITCIVEPVTFIAAINREIGNKYLAYASLTILAIWLVWTVASYLITKNAGKKAATEEERQELELKKGWELQGGGLASITRKIFFALPDLYLVYIIAIVMMR